MDNFADLDEDVVKRLVRHNIHNLSDLVELTELQIGSLPGFGILSLKTLKTFLRHRKLYLKPSIEPLSIQNIRDAIKSLEAMRFERKLGNIWDDSSHLALEISARYDGLWKTLSRVESEYQAWELQLIDRTLFSRKRKI